jgi:orotidine-5'-phosphate decarboxylase
VTPSRVIFALDVPSLDRARSMAMAVRDAVGMFKVGLELFIESGHGATSIGAETGRPIFLDLKLHDIPETVERSVARAAALGARWITVHASGGPAMLKRAVERTQTEGTGLEIVAVTILTSLDDRDLAAIGFSGDVGASADTLGRMAWEQGVRSFVCSPQEAARLRAALGPQATLITPGVRASGAGSPDDQKRTLSASEAIERGADWVVVGRPIRDASEPLSVARILQREVDEALSRKAAH